MLTQKNPNAWSCLPTAFANSLEVSVDAILAVIGHDGSEITHPGLPDPMRRRGFHPQEFIEMCFRDNLAVIQIDANPSAVPIQQSGHVPGLFATIHGENHWERFERHMFNSEGVIDCRTRIGLGHALSYVGYNTYATIADPATGETFEYWSRKDIELRGLYFVSLFRLDALV